MLYQILFQLSIMFNHMKYDILMLSNTKVVHTRFYLDHQIANFLESSTFTSYETPSHGK